MTNRPRNFFEKMKSTLVNKSKHICFIPFWNRKQKGFHMRLKSTSGRHFRLLKSLPVAQKSLKTILYAPQIKAYNISYPFRPRIRWSAHAIERNSVFSENLLREHVKNGFSWIVMNVRNFFTLFNVKLCVYASNEIKNPKNFIELPKNLKFYFWNIQF